MPHHWDIARAAKTMGATTTIKIDPTRITVRIKNKLLKWLKDGEYVGGYSSMARRLAEALANKYDLPSSLKHWRGVEIKHPTRDMANEVIELLRADWTAYILEYPHVNKREHWAYQRYHNQLSTLERLGSLDYLYVHHHEYTKQVHLIVEKYSKNHHEAARQAAIAALNGTEPIEVMILEN